MKAVESQPAQSIAYPPRTVTRARRALACSPFTRVLFEAMKTDSVPLGAIASESGIQQNYTRRAIAELRVENDLMWLIQVGVLRREVDGQGITDSFRLTPLGRQLIDRQDADAVNWGAPGWCDRLYNTGARWLRLPF
jgi:hypothetical protein